MDENIDDIIKYINSNRKKYSHIHDFSKEPGIYAIYFHGKSFPISEIKFNPDNPIYIGKTEKSQESRDAKTHFATGKTGSSTVRKTLGSLLREEFNLTSLPRNDSDYENGRFSHFIFSFPGEMKITEWMISNLSLSFYKYPKSKEEIDALETKIIHNLIPPLNIDYKNPGNPFTSIIKNYRKSCATIAIRNSGFIRKKSDIKSDNSKSSKYSSDSKGTRLYEGIWRNMNPRILEFLMSNKKEISIQLDSGKFENAGNRKSYSFNLEFTSGKVGNNIGGSAVARDLASVLENLSSISPILKEGKFKFRLDSGFCLFITKS